MSGGTSKTMTGIAMIGRFIKETSTTLEGSAISTTGIESSSMITMSNSFVPAIVRRASPKSITAVFRPDRQKKWQIGYPLPRGVIYYDLPPAIVMQLGPPQPGYRYARVDSDILLIAIGTGLVVDAILGLSGN